MAVSSLVPAATGPTLSEITTAGTSAGWGAIGGGTTWTAISTPSVSGVASFNFSLSGYKYYKLVFSNLSLSGNSQLWFQFNGVSTNTYGHGGFQATDSTLRGSVTQNNNRINTGAENYSSAINGYVLLENAGLTGAHVLEYEINARNGAPAQCYARGHGSWTATDAITSMQFFVNSVTCSSGSITLWGGN